MAMNLGIGGPPKKKGVPPPPFGGSPAGPAAKAAPAFGSKGGADVIGAADEGGVGAKTPLPDGRGSTGDEGIPPEAVCYRSAMETCGACEYNEGGQCSKLAIPVSDGDGCNLFKDRAGGQDAGAAETFEAEPEPVAA